MQLKMRAASPWHRPIFCTICFCMVGLAGCETVESVSEVENIVRPAIGQTATKEVGEPLFETIVARTYDGISFSPGSRVSLPLGIVYELNEPLVFSSKRGAEEIFCGTVTVVHTAIGDTHLMQVVCVGTHMLRGINYNRGKVTRSDASNFQRQLLYEGRTGKEIRLSYREFRADFARPAFSQELTFDLSEGDVVWVKGARVEVLKATNVDIQYRVLKSFSD